MSDQASRPVGVTGAGSGIGRATIELLPSSGRSVFAGARGSTDLESLGELPNLAPLRLDVTRPEGVIVTSVGERVNAARSRMGQDSWRI
jgi:NADP-dependent 3-hydroxy acid dehydrogenase YdfG